MKKIFAIVAISTMSCLNAQVVIGGSVGKSTNTTSVLLDFPPNLNKGIIVPYVTQTLPTASASNAGTILLDAKTATASRMKYSNGTTWVDLSGQDGNITAALVNQPTVGQVPEDPNSKAVIGNLPATADGVLVLESTTKAMVLPTVSDVNLIPSPSPGMMVYVDKAGFKRFAVFNGEKWSYWKP